MDEGLSNGKKKNVRKSTSEKKEPAQPLTKRQELNNHIVHMRNGVRQARVQIINRLVSQIQKYKNRKGNPKEQEKAKRKADRIVEEVLILKKIKKDIVSLYALQDIQDLEAVLNNPQSSSEERVLARLSHHNVIIKDVQQYRNENPNWDRQIPVLLEMTKQKRGKKEDVVETPVVVKKPEGNSGKTKISDSDNNGDVDDENSVFDIKEEPESDSDSEEEQEKESDEDDSVEEEELDSDNADSEEEEKSAPLSVHKSKDTVHKFKQGKLEPNIKGISSKSNVSVTPVLNKSEGTVKVKFLTDLNDLEKETFKESGDNKQFIDITKRTQAKKPKSAFFVGGVDEPESDPESNRHFAKSQKSFQDYQNGQSKPVYKKGKLISKPVSNNRSQGKFPQNRKAPFREGAPKNPRFGGNAEPFGAKKPRISNDFYENRLLNPQKTVEAVSAEKLHPSWEAKKKQQQISLTEFKGKKIVFGDDD